MVEWWSRNRREHGNSPQGIQVTEPERVKTRREPRDNRVDKSSISAGECSSDPSGEVGWMGVTWGSLVRKKPGIYIWGDQGSLVLCLWEFCSIGGQGFVVQKHVVGLLVCFLLGRGVVLFWFTRRGTWLFVHQQVQIWQVVKSSHLEVGFVFGKTWVSLGSQHGFLF